MTDKTVWMLVVLIIFLSLLDLGANILSFIPFIGAFFSTLAESILELITIITAIILGLKSKNG